MSRISLTVTLVVTFCLLALSANAQPRPKPMRPATPDPGDKAIRKVDKSIQKLARLEKMLVRARKLKRSDIESIKLELQAIHSDLLTVKGEIINIRARCLQPTHPLRPIKKPVKIPIKPAIVKKPKGPAVMPGEAFTRLLATMDQQSFASDKLTVLKEAARSNSFTVVQVKQLLGRMTHSSDKLDLLSVVKKRIFDRKNLFEIYSSLTFSGDKDAAKKILEGGK